LVRGRLAAPLPTPDAKRELPSMRGTVDLPAGVAVSGDMRPGYGKILTPAAIAFLAGLEREFGAERRRLLNRRAEIQQRLDTGWKPDFLPETRSIRDGDWQVAPIPNDIRDRRVEITGPTDRKMVINALNCGANVFMADFEDANTPSWSNMMEGQANLFDAVRARSLSTTLRRAGITH
jgi:malate synthase